MALTNLKLNKCLTITGTIVTKSGLKIGGTESGIDIGGAENPVIRDYWGMPYIPGSSLKGKLRSLLEIKEGRFGRDGSGRQGDGAPCGCARSDCLVCITFGPHKNAQHTLGPTRIIVRDAYLSDDTRKIVENMAKEGKGFSETKTETMIDRWTGVAARGSLRTQERIPVGSRFNLEITLRIFVGDDEDKIKNFVTDGIKKLENDYLGGSGTRGYGWVKIENLKVVDC